ncbi:MAG TPA: ATP-binding protein [Vicinamibacteria bacterium]|nr:ATP-binding protein [Vicinamibacteria bacterium]
MLTVLFVVFALGDTLSWLTRPGYLPPWYGYVLIIAAWLLNRSGRYPAAAGVALAAFPIVNLWQATTEAGADTRDTLSYLVVGVLLASMLLSVRGMLVFSSTLLLGIALLPQVAPAAASVRDIISPLLLVAISAGVAAVWMAHRDRIERDRQAVLRDGEQRLRLALDAARMLSWELDVASGAMRWSRRAPPSAGPEQLGLAGSLADYLQLVHTDDRAAVAEAFARAQDVAGNGLLDVEHRLQPADGQAQWLYVRSQTFFEGEGPGRRAVRAMGVVIDVTDRKRAEEQQQQLEQQLLQAQKMEAVGRLAGGIAHDFNNLLMVIINCSMLPLRDRSLAAGARRHLEAVCHAGESAANLTRQLLAFSRRQVLQPAVVDLDVLVTRMERLLRRIIGEDVTLQTRLAPDLWPIFVDAGQMEQVIVNLAVNSRDAMPRGGRITIETGNTLLDEEYARQHADTRPGEYVLLSFTDDGIGMDAATLSRIFEPFFTTKGPHGTGLGLSTVHGIVRQSGGHVRPHSAPGLGTTFRIYIPRCTAAQAAPAPLRRIPARSRGETVLVVEDSPEVRRLVVDVLAERGQRVLEAADPEEAMQLAARHPGTIDLLVSDLVLPGMSGREMSARLVAGRPTLAVLYMSGYTEDAVVDQPLPEGADFIAKPFTLDQLVRKVEEILARRRSGTPART